MTQNRLNLFLFTWFIAVINGQEPLAILPQGRVAGIKIYTKTGLVPVEIFLGIPYAVAPTGKRRHAPPEPHPGWKKTLFAHRMPPICPQAGDPTVRGYVSEDCLFLNIWTPQRVDGSSLSVVVIFYSESWREGPKSPLTCEELAAENLVVVTVAYRLHMLSFFTLQTSAAPGNLALLDQHQALLWIKQNIEVFGGDPTSVTVMGHSAGADSVLNHIASERSLGLFSRAVVMSPNDIWRTFQKEITSAKDMKRLNLEYASNLACTSTSTDEVIECLRSRPLQDILNVFKIYNITDAIRPIPDAYLPESEQFIPKSLAEVLADNVRPIIQLDLLLGSADLEAIDINFSFENFMKVAGRGKNNLLEYAKTVMIPELLDLISLTSSANRILLTEAILWEYWSSKSSGEGSEEARTLENLARAQSSVRWGAATALLAARLARRLSRLYVYRYTQPGGVDLTGRQLNYTGAVHGADLMSFLGEAMLLQVARRPPTAAEQRASNSLRRYIVNFVKYGSPSSETEWPRYRVGEAYIHNLRDKQIVGPHLDHSAARDIAFWLQYLPHLSNLITSPDQAQLLPLEKGEQRLRGGVFALTAVTVVLLTLLLACLALLRWQHMKRSRGEDDEDIADLSPQTL